jgi:hypothetical protein
VPKAMTIAEIQEASEKDITICKIRECIEKNKWTKEGELKPYFIVRKDLTVHESIILKGRKLVIPRKLRLERDLLFTIPLPFNFFSR